MSVNTNRVLAIDPGTIQSAYVVWNKSQRIIEEKGIVPNDQMLLLIQSIQFNYEIDVAIEMIASYGMPVGKEVFHTILWIGRFMQVSKMCKLIYRKDIKIHFCNSNKAKDSNIRQALIDAFGEVGTKKNPGVLYGVSKDIWSALAIGVYYSSLKEK